MKFGQYFSLCGLIITEKFKLIQKSRTHEQIETNAIVIRNTSASFIAPLYDYVFMKSTHTMQWARELFSKRSDSARLERTSECTYDSEQSVNWVVAW